MYVSTYWSVSTNSHCMNCLDSVKQVAYLWAILWCLLICTYALCECFTMIVIYLMWLWKRYAVTHNFQTNVCMCACIDTCRWFLIVCTGPTLSDSTIFLNDPWNALLVYGLCTHDVYIVSFFLYIISEWQMIRNISLEPASTITANALLAFCICCLWSGVP